MTVSFDNVIGRMKLAGRLKNDSKVARILGITPQAISNYKKRGTFPPSLVIKFSNIYGLSVDWLLRGDGETYRPGIEKRPILTASENAQPYSELRRSDVSSLVEFAGLSPDELIFVGKLLRILRDPDTEYAKTVKHVLNAM